MSLRCPSLLPPLILRTKVGAKSVESRWRSVFIANKKRRHIELGTENELTSFGKAGWLLKFRKSRIAWKAILLVTEVHTRRRRGCPRIETIAVFCSLEGCTWLAFTYNLSQCTALQAEEGLCHNPRTFSFHSHVRGYSWYCLPGNSLFSKSDSDD